jgi:hypothetical protein
VGAAQLQGCFMSLAGKLRSFVFEQKCVPWRVQHEFECWMELRALERFPAFYRLIRFGRGREIVRPVTTGPKHHFFGYYEKTPWNLSGRLLLAHEVDFNDRPPAADDRVTIGVVHVDDDNRFEALSEGHAWNWQQGAMTQWHPADPERLFIHNDRRDGRLVAVVRHVNGDEVKTYERPVYAVAPDGKQALSLNFARLQRHRPGYGYAGVTDPWADEPHPVDDGIHLMDLEGGTSRLIISLEQLATLNPKEGMQGAHHWINHIQFSRGGRRFAFFHIWRVGEAGWSVRFYTAKPDGSELRCLLDTGMVSHYDWLDDRRIMIWARHPDGRDRFLFLDDGDGSISVVGESVLTEDGHCTFSPDGKWVLNDTYPDVYQLRTLMLFDPDRGKRTDLARLRSPKDKWWGEIRCDLHPRWSRDGSKVCIDSVHSGERQMYVVDLKGVV